MSDSGFSNLPSGIAKRTERFPTSKEGGLNARILEVSGELRELKQTTRIAGKVAERTADNSIEIKTDRGDVKVRIPREERVPDKGEDVEVELSAGKPPRKARVEQPQTQTTNTQNTEQTAPQSAAQNSTQTENTPAPYQPAERTESTAPPRPLHQSTAATEIPQQLPRSSALEADTTVRLTPLTTAQLDNLTNGITQITAAKLQVIDHALHVLQQNQISELTQALTQNTTSNTQASQSTQNLLTQTSPLEQLQQQFTNALQEAPAPLLTLQNIVQEVAASTVQNSNQSPLNQLLTIINAAHGQDNAAHIAQPAIQTSLISSNAAPDTTLKTFQHLPQGTPVSVLEPLSLNSLSILNNVITAAADQIHSALQNLLNHQSGLIQNAITDQLANPALSTLQPQTHSQVQAQTTPQTFIDAQIKNISQPTVKLFDASGQTIQQSSTENAAGGLSNLTPLSTPLGNDAPQARTLRAEVIGFTGDRSLPVLSFFSGSGSFTEPFSMQYIASNLSQGSQIDLIPSLHQIGTQPQAAAIQAAATPASLFSALTQMQWPALNELNTVLQQPAMQNVVQSSMQHLPSPATPSRMPAAALLFIAAVNAGDIGGFLNDKTTDLLRRSGKGDLIKKLGNDMKSIARISSEPVSQDWKAIPLPMAHEGEIQQIMLYYKKDGGSGDNYEGEDNQGTRFLFNLSLNKMGPVQLDGYHRSERLDLIVRMETRPSSEMQQAMRRVYINALEQAGSAGELSFQLKSDQWITIEGAHENTFYHA